CPAPHRDAWVVGSGQADGREPSGAGDHVAEKHPVVGLAGLVAEHGDEMVPVPVGGGEVLDEAGPDHPVPDDDDVAHEVTSCAMGDRRVGEAGRTSTAQTLNSGIDEIGSTASLV